MLKRKLLPGSYKFLVQQLSHDEVLYVRIKGNPLVLIKNYREFIIFLEIVLWDNPIEDIDFYSINYDAYE